MAKSNKQPKDEDKTSDDIQGQMLDLLKDMNASIGALNQRVVELEERSGPKNATEEIAVEIEKKKKAEPKYDIASDETVEEKRIDKRYRAIVDEVLGKQFEAWESYEGTLPGHFRFSILVPKELSSIPQEQHKRANCEHENKKVGCKLPPDIRSCTISFQEHENGVRHWCLLVRQNLNRFYSQSGVRSPFGQAAE